MPDSTRGQSRQVLARLEQRHHVEHRRPAAERVLGQLVDGGDVVGGTGEGDDVAGAGGDAEPLLDPGDHPDRGQHLLGALGGSRPPSISSSAAACTCGVLADLQLRQVEAERLDLPDEVLQLAVRLPRRAGRGQRLLGDPQVGEQLAGRAVGEVEVAAAGGGDAGGTNISHCRCGSRGERVAISETSSGWASTAAASAALQLGRRRRELRRQR